MPYSIHTIMRQTLFPVRLVVGMAMIVAVPFMALGASAAEGPFFTRSWGGLSVL